MPIDNNGATPAEIMFGRQIRNLIPNDSKKQNKNSEFVNELRKRQM